MSGEVDRVIETVKRRSCFFPLGPPAVLLSFTLTLTGIVLTDLIVYRTCLVSLNINATDCLMLRTNSGTPEAVDLEAKVEPYASIIVMINSLIETLLPAVLTLFLGPWSDRNGRRPLLLAALTGFTLQSLILSLMSNWIISPWYLLIATTSASMVGGLCTVMLASVCNISDTTKDNERMLHLILLEGSFYGGDLLGTLISPSIYKNYGYTGVFVTASICCVLALVYTYFYIPETVKSTSEESTSGQFKLSFVKELVKSSFSKRDGFNQPIVLLGISTYTLALMIYRGHLTIGFLFARVRLGWDVSRYSYFSSAEITLRIIGLCAVSLISRILEISDSLLAGLALTSALGSAITKSLAWKSWHMYLAAGIEVLSGVILPVTRSIILKFVPTEDVGRVFSLTELLGASSSLGGSPLYTVIFSHYLPPIYPSPVHMFSSCIYASLILCVVCMNMLIKKSKKSTTYIPASQDDDQ